MAKTNGPLLSMAAHGTIGNVLTYSKNIVKQVRYQRKQKDVLTTKRITHRTSFTTAVNIWNLLSATEKEEWNQKAAYLRITGYDLFIKTWFEGPPSPPPLGDAILGEGEAGFAELGSEP